jgi:hypothetical protein
MTRPETSDPEQIRRDIERTQAHLSRDVDVLTEKVTPSRIVERRVNRVRSTFGRWRDNVMGSAPSVHPGAYRGTASDVRESARQVTDSVTDTASSAKDSVAGAVSDAAGAVQEAPETVRRQTQGNPLAAGLIAFGAGWLISSLLPASRREQELAEQARGRASELGRPLAQAAGEMKESLTEPARQAVESVRSTATEAGRAVADEGRSAAQQVQDQARESASTVRQSQSG